MNICKRCKPQAGCDFQSIYHFLLVYQSPLQPLPSQILDIWKIFVPFSKTGRQKARLPERFAECTCEQQRPLHHGRTTSDAAEKHSSSFKPTHPSGQFWSYFQNARRLLRPKYACVSRLKVPFTEVKASLSKFSRFSEFAMGGDAESNKLSFLVTWDDPLSGLSRSSHISKPNFYLIVSFQMSFLMQAVQPDI